MPAIVCPTCHGPLIEDPYRWSCTVCGSDFPALGGVPDLRVAEDGYLPNADDWRLAQRLEASIDRLDFRALLDLYYEISPEIDAGRRAVQIGHILTAEPRAAGWIDALGDSLPDGPWLDLGCGSGSFLTAVGPDREVVGLDVALRWLLVARKRLHEAGRCAVRLVGGNAERLPFADASFAAVVAGDVIEHVADQAATLAEAYRVLMPGGRLFLATPNRYSLAPEPHVGVWGVGYLPRRWMSTYVWAMRKRSFRAIHTLGYAQWKRLFASSPFGGAAVTCPALPPSDLAAMRRFKRRLAAVYNRVVTTRSGQAASRALGPLFHIVATRPVSPPTSPPPPPATTPPA